MMNRRLIRGALPATVLVALAVGHAATARANETVMVCDVYGDQVAPSPGGVYGIGASTTCPGSADPVSYSAGKPPGGMALWTAASNTVPQGTAVHWSVHAPVGMSIAGVYLPHMYSHGIDD